MHSFLLIDILMFLKSSFLPAKRNERFLISKELNSDKGIFPLFSAFIEVNSYILLNATLASLIGIVINAKLATEGNKEPAIPKIAINSPNCITSLYTCVEV